MNIKDMIKKLKEYKNQHLEVIITVGNEDNDTLSTTDFEFFNKDEEHEYIEIFINEEYCRKQL